MPTVDILGPRDAIRVPNCGDTRWVSAIREDAKHIQTLIDDVRDAAIPDGILARFGVAIASRAAATYFKTCAAVHSDPYYRELKSIADATDIDVSDLVLANSIYDIMQRIACTSVSISTGKPVMLRTLDWGLPDSLGLATRIYRIQDRYGGYLSVGFPGFVGVLSAMRPGAWAVTINQAPVDPSSTSILPGLPTLVRIRNACARSNSYRGLIANLKSCKPDTPFTAHVIGTKDGESTVIEHQLSAVGVRQGYLLAAANHLPDEDSEDTESIQRYRAALRRYKRPKNLDISTFVRAPIRRHDTQQAMRLCPATGEMVVHAFGPH